MSSLTRRLAVGTLLAALAGTAAAHPGHGSHGLLEGLAHPFAIDHLLAAVAVGMWSAAALPGARRWLGPLGFLVAMMFGAVAGAAGIGLPFMEAGIAASVLLMGVMLVAVRRLPPAAGLGLIVVCASLHGLAHGAELPVGASFASYAAGFVITTAALQLGALALGERIGLARTWAWRAGGALLGAVGLALLVAA